MINYKKTKCLLGLMALPSLLLASENGNNTLLAVDKIDTGMAFIDSYPASLTSTSAKSVDDDADRDVQHTDRVQYLIERIQRSHTAKIFELPDDLLSIILIDFLGSGKDFAHLCRTCRYFNDQVPNGVLSRSRVLFTSGKSEESLVALGHFCGKNSALFKKLVVKGGSIITDRCFIRGVHKGLETAGQDPHKTVFKQSLKMSIWDFYCLENFATNWLIDANCKVTDIKINPLLFFSQDCPIKSDEWFFENEEETYGEVEIQSMMQQYCSMMVKVPMPVFMGHLNDMIDTMLPLYNTESALFPFMKSFLVSPEKEEKMPLGALIALYKKRILEEPSDEDDTNSKREDKVLKLLLGDLKPRFSREEQTALLALYDDENHEYADRLSRECILAADVAITAYLPCRLEEKERNIKFDVASNVITNDGDTDSMTLIEAYIQDTSDRCICKKPASKALFLYFLVTSVLNVKLSEVSPQAVKRAVCKLFGDGAAYLPASFVEKDQSMEDVYALFKHLVD